MVQDLIKFTENDLFSERIYVQFLSCVKFVWVNNSQSRILNKINFCLNELKNIHNL